jgi:hypothetical protein
LAVHRPAPKDIEKDIPWHECFSCKLGFGVKQMQPNEVKRMGHYSCDALTILAAWCQHHPHRKRIKVESAITLGSLADFIREGSCF